jgi:hypothetical protein
MPNERLNNWQIQVTRYLPQATILATYFTKKMVTPTLFHIHSEAISSSKNSLRLTTPE